MGISAQCLFGVRNLRLLGRGHFLGVLAAVAVSVGIIGEKQM